VLSSKSAKRRGKRAVGIDERAEGKGKGALGFHEGAAVSSKRSKRGGKRARSFMNPQGSFNDTEGVL